ncbi:hypothetical protein K2W90_05535 [Candidatus Babeliales bacterium]|nr:hypothetical protein [Candidatus Babeliales bacterium]
MQKLLIASVLAFGLGMQQAACAFATQPALNVQADVETLIAHAQRNNLSAEQTLKLAKESIDQAAHVESAELEVEQSNKRTLLIVAGVVVVVVVVAGVAYHFYKKKKADEQGGGGQGGGTNEDLATAEEVARELHKRLNVPSHSVLTVDKLDELEEIIADPVLTLHLSKQDCAYLGFGLRQMRAELLAKGRASAPFEGFVLEARHESLTPKAVDFYADELLRFAPSAPITTALQAARLVRWYAGRAPGSSAEREELFLAELRRRDKMPQEERALFDRTWARLEEEARGRLRNPDLLEQVASGSLNISDWVREYRDADMVSEIEKAK